MEILKHLIPKKVRGMASRAIKDSTRAMPDGGQYQGRTDALRHMLLNGQLAQAYGPVAARGLGAAYEALNPAGVVMNPADTMMDLHNNGIGAEIGAKTPDYQSLLREAVERVKQSKQRPPGLAAALSDRTNTPVHLTLPQSYKESRRPAKPAPDSLRPDGSKKGNGWLGPMPTKDGRTATEISVGQEIDGTEVLMPTMVPTLDKSEIDWLLNNDVSDPKSIPASIMDKAAAHAKQRIAAGKSPFKD